MRASNELHVSEPKAIGWAERGDVGSYDWIAGYPAAIHELNTSWLTYFHTRVAEELSLPQHLVSCAIDAWSAHEELLEAALTDFQNILRS